MDQTALQDFMDEINWLFHPEPEEDGDVLREFPNDRLKSLHGLDVTYMKTLVWEGSTIHKHTRIRPADEENLQILTRSQDVPDRLFRGNDVPKATAARSAHVRRPFARPGCPGSQLPGRGF